MPQAASRGQERAPGQASDGPEGGVSPDARTSRTDPPERFITIWQNNAWTVPDPDRRLSVYEFSLSARGSPLGVVEDIAIETNLGRISVPGVLGGTPAGGYRTARLETDEYGYAVAIAAATATVDGVPGRDIVPYLRILDYQPMPILLPDDPESVLNSVRYYEIPKFLVDAPVDFGEGARDAPMLYISDFVEAAVQIYRDMEDTDLMVWNGATLLDRPVEGPYVVLFSRDGVNGFSVMQPSASGFEGDYAVFTFRCRVEVDVRTRAVRGLDPEIIVDGERQDVDYAVKNNPIVARAFSFGS
jgi:hypothetical protein